MSRLHVPSWQRGVVTHHAVVPCYPHEMDVLLRGEPGHGHEHGNKDTTEHERKHNAVNTRRTRRN